MARHTSVRWHRNPALIYPGAPEHARGVISEIARNTVDTETRTGNLPRGVGYFLDEPKKGIVTFHVTDNPYRVIAQLKAGSNLSITRQTGDLGGGLYCSTAVDLWHCRSARRWLWVQDLNEEDQHRLTRWLEQTADLQLARGYIYKSDHERIKDIISWAKTIKAGPEHLVTVMANQPYNVSPLEMTQGINVPPPGEPEQIKVILRGKFYNYDDRSDDFIRATKAWSDSLPLDDRIGKIGRGFGRPWDETENSFLYSLGFSGKFCSGYVFAPQIVIWDSKAIRRFGSWQNSYPRPNA